MPELYIFSSEYLILKNLIFLDGKYDVKKKTF